MLLHFQFFRLRFTPFWRFMRQTPRIDGPLRESTGGLGEVRQTEH